MVDLKPLDMIPHLTHLDISGNLLKDLHRIIEILARIPSLQVGLSHKFVYFTFLSIVTTCRSQKSQHRIGIGSADYKDLYRLIGSTYCSPLLGIKMCLK